MSMNIPNLRYYESLDYKGKKIEIKEFSEKNLLSLLIKSSDDIIVSDRFDPLLEVFKYIYGDNDNLVYKFTGRIDHWEKSLDSKFDAVFVYEYFGNGRKEDFYKLKNGISFDDIKDFNIESELESCVLQYSSTTFEFKAEGIKRKVTTTVENGRISESVESEKTVDGVIILEHLKGGIIIKREHRIDNQVIKKYNLNDSGDIIGYSQFYYDDNGLIRTDTLIKAGAEYKIVSQILVNYHSEVEKNITYYHKISGELTPYAINEYFLDKERSQRTEVNHYRSSDLLEALFIDFSMEDEILLSDIDFEQYNFNFNEFNNILLKMRSKDFEDLSYSHTSVVVKNNKGDVLSKKDFRGEYSHEQIRLMDTYYSRIYDTKNRLLSLEVFEMDDRSKQIRLLMIQNLKYIDESSRSHPYY